MHSHLKPRHPAERGVNRQWLALSPEEVKLMIDMSSKRAQLPIRFVGWMALSHSPIKKLQLVFMSTLLPLIYVQLG